MFGKWLCVLYVYIIFFKGISYITCFSVMAGEQRKCLYHSEYYAVRKGILFFFFIKKKVKLTLTMLLNVCVSLLLLKINEPVR